MGTLPCASPALPDLVFRRRLESIHARLTELAHCAPPLLRYDFAAILGGVEDALEKAGWQPPPLTEHDLAVLAALGCPA